MISLQRPVEQEARRSGSLLHSYRSLGSYVQAAAASGSEDYRLLSAQHSAAPRKITRSSPCAVSEIQLRSHELVGLVVSDGKTDLSRHSLHLLILHGDRRYDAGQSFVAPDLHQSPQQFGAEPLTLSCVDDDERELAVVGAVDLRSSRPTAKIDASPARRRRSATSAISRA